MRIVIDARMYGLEHAGIGRYVKNLIDKLESSDFENSYFVLLRKKCYQSLQFENKNFKKILADYNHYSFSEQIFLRRKIAQLSPDVVHFPHFNLPVFYKKRYIVTIHDLIKHQFRGHSTTTKNPLFYWLKYLGYRIVFKNAVENALKVIVPSKEVKSQLLKNFPNAAGKVKVVYEGVEEKFSNPVKNGKILTKYKIKKPFVVYTGSVYPHKNINRLLQSIKVINTLYFNKLNKKKLYLVISCARSVFWKKLAKKVKEIKLEEYVRLPGFIPDKELATLYNEASCFVFPTLSEGFGLPGLEAMAAGLPVVCSDLPVLREVYGDAAFYFNPLNVEEMAEKISEFVCSSGRIKRDKIIKKGFSQVKKYSWKKMARETLTIYKSIQENPS